MSDYTQTDIGSGYNSTSSINTELTQVETAVNSKVDKSGSVMTGQLDMNSNKILNVPEGTLPTDAVNYAQLISRASFSAADAKFYDTVTLWQADGTSSAGDVVILKDRANGVFDVISGTGTADTFGIVAHTTLSLSLDIRIEPIMFTSAFGVLDSVDSTGAYQAAVNAVTHTINDKTTITTATINVPSFKILDCLPNASITNTTDNDIFGHTSDATNNHIKIVNFTAVGNSTGTNQYFSNIGSCSYVEVSDNNLSECTQGIHFSTCTYYRAINNVIDGGRRGVLVEGASNFGTISNNTITDTDESCIKVLGGDDIDITDNDCSTSKDSGIAVAGYTGFRFKISRNRCHDNGTTGSLKNGINTHGLSDSEVSYNVCKSNAGTGIDISGHTGDPLRVAYTSAIGNFCIDNLGAGLKIFTAEKTLVQGNQLHGNDQNLVVQGSGGGADIELSNNLCFDSTDTSPRANLYVNQADGSLYIHDNTIGERTTGASGSHDGTSNASVLTDTSARWPVDVWAGETITNSTDGSTATVVSNTATTVTATLTGGSGNDWDSDDSYTIGVSTMFGLYLDANITGKVILGYNNFDSCASSKPVQMAHTINNMELTNSQVYTSDIIDLSGAVVHDPVPIPNIPKFSFIHKVRIIYTEATSADAGIVVGLGDGGASPTKWATGTTETSKAVGNELLLTLNRRGRLDSNTVPYFYSAGSKTGTGAVRIIVEYDPLIPVNF